MQKVDSFQSADGKLHKTAADAVAADLQHITLQLSDEQISLGWSAAVCIARNHWRFIDALRQLDQDKDCGEDG